MQAHKVLFPLVLLFISHRGTAADLPGAGAQIQQIPPTPALTVPRPEIRIMTAPPGVAPAVDDTRFAVQTLRIQGASIYAVDELLAASGFVPGAEVTLAELQAMAQRIAQRYRDAGYVLAQAYLPPQEVSDGAVNIVVAEGRYGKIASRNDSGLSNALVADFLGALHAGEPVMLAPLESSLLQLSDLPGINVSSTLSPGAVPGTADLLVGLSPGPRVSGSVEADNAGSRYSGVYRAGASLQVNHLLGFGDAASVRGLTSNGGLRYGRLGYELQAGRVRLGAAYSMLDYRLGREFDILDANGRASVASLYGSYPLIRSRQTSLHAQLMFERKGLHDRIDAVASVSDRTVHTLTASLYGNRRDDLAGGGISTGSLALSAGSVDIQTAQQRQVDALTALTNGAFRKLNLNATRQQQITPQFSLYGALTMQAASKNLITAEKMALGGVYAVRAYPEGEAYADQAVLLTVEGRYRLPTQDFLPAQVHLIAFADSASGKLNKSPWSDGVRRRTLSGAGLGLTAHENGNYMVRLYYAHRLGTERDTPAPDRDGRFWLQAVKFF